MDFNYWRDRGDRAFDGEPVAKVLAKTRAIVGPLDIPADETMAQTALDKLADNQMPSADELAALEVVIRTLRPAPVTRGGVLDDLPDYLGANQQTTRLREQWREFREISRNFIGSIGRVEFKNGTHVGTGFLVAADLLATNRHVLGQLTWGTELLQAGRAQVVMNREIDGSSSGDFLPILGVEHVHPTLDMVLLKVASGNRPPLEIDATLPASGSQVVAIGYPGNDGPGNPFFLKAVFGTNFGVRRASIGEVLYGSRDPNVFHDCSVTAGSSGSPVLSLTTGKVVGIHRGGIFMFRNEAVCGMRLEEFRKGGVA